MAEFSKSEKKSLRELAGVVYEAEARLALDELDAQFERWRSGEMLGSELIAAIHEFHQQDARSLWSMYQSLKEPEIVARGAGPRADHGRIRARAATGQARAPVGLFQSGFEVVVCEIRRSATAASFTTDKGRYVAEPGAAAGRQAACRRMPTSRGNGDA